MGFASENMIHIVIRCNFCLTISAKCSWRNWRVWMRAGLFSKSRSLLVNCFFALHFFLKGKKNRESNSDFWWCCLNGVLYSTGSLKFEPLSMYCRTDVLSGLTKSKQKVPARCLYDATIKTLDESTFHIHKINWCRRVKKFGGARS